MVTIQTKIGFIPVDSKQQQIQLIYFFNSEEHLTEPIYKTIQMKYLISTKLKPLKTTFKFSFTTTKIHTHRQNEYVLLFTKYFDILV